MRIFYSQRSDPMILDSIRNLNAIHANLVVFLASEKTSKRINALTGGSPEPYAEFLPYLELNKSEGKVTVQFGNDNGLLISGAQENLRAYITAFEFSEDENGNHHHPDFSLASLGLWPFIQADNDYVEEHDNSP